MRKCLTRMRADSFATSLRTEKLIFIKNNFSREVMNIIQNVSELETFSFSRLKRVHIPFTDLQVMRLNLILGRINVMMSLNPRIAKLNYHGHAHTMDAKRGVLAEAYRLCSYHLDPKDLNERITPDEAELILIAAAFHDIGFMMQYQNNEPIGAEISIKTIRELAAKNPSLGFEKINTERIAKMISSTEVPTHPKDICSMILCDADVANFGRDDFLEKGKEVREELSKEMGLNFEDKTWHEMTLKLMEPYFRSEGARKLWGKKKKENEATLIKLLKEEEKII